MFSRPLVFTVPAAAAALYGAVCLGLPVNLYISLLLLGIFLTGAGLTVCHIRLFTVCSMLAAAAFALSGLAVFNMAVVAPVRSMNGRNAVITATVLQDAVVYEDNQRAELSIDQGDALPRSFRALCYLPLTEEPLLAGDRVKVSTGFYLASDMEGFDRAVYQAADGCFITASYTKTKEGEPITFSVLPSERGSIRFLPQRIARFCREAVAQALPARQAGLLNALLLGDKSGLSDDDELSLRIAGLSHLIAVSGLHIGFLVAFCYFLLGRRYGTIVSIPLVLSFVPVAGATPSVIRAAVMYLITAGAFVSRREANGLNSLFVALALLLLTNPYSISSLSLQLSFAATLGLILFAGKMQRRLTKPFAARGRIIKKAASVAAGALSCSVCAMVFTTPILLSSFGYVSILSILSNLLVTGITSVCFIGGFLLCICTGCFPIAVPVLAAVVRPLLGAILFIAEEISEVPFGLINWTDGFGVAALLVFLAGVLLWLLAGKHIRWRFALPVFCIAVTGLTVSGAYYDRSHYTITYLPCGVGQAIIVSDAAQHMTLIDCSGDSGYHNAAALVQEWMRWHGFRKIDTLILTAVDKGHARNLPELLTQTEVGEIWIPAGCKETKTNQELFRLVRESAAQPVDQKMILDTSGVPITVFPITDGKLGVLIGDKALVLHSPTQKQLSEFWQKDNTYTAPVIVLAQRNMEDAELLSETLQFTQAERILIQAATKDILPRYGGIPVESPYLSGEIQMRYAKGAA